MTTSFTPGLAPEALAMEKGVSVYPKSLHRLKDGWACMADAGETDVLLVTGEGTRDFEGEATGFAGGRGMVAPLSAANAQALRSHFPFTAPVPVLGQPRSIGLGDRLGIAAAGHIRAVAAYDVCPVFAQQSIRELNLTGRDYGEVLDRASFAVFCEHFVRGFGADGDHLKTAAEVAGALALGYTMITLDCSEHIDNGVDVMDAAGVDAACPLSADYRDRYLGRTFTVGPGVALSFDEDALKRAVLIYARAIDFAEHIYSTLIRPLNGRVDFEISIDETATPTLPLQHLFVAEELRRRGVRFATVAPRFCGEFQKGVDYIGDLAQFETELKAHVAIARHYGYKLSIHSGSDKFSVFEAIGRCTEGQFHVKTAGTNWLLAMQVAAASDPALYRQVHDYALRRFADAAKFYHVTTDLAAIPGLETLADSELPGLFLQNDARQLIHITYGFILTEKAADGGPLYRDRLYRLWRQNRGLYAQLLDTHIGKHLALLYAGFEN